MNILITNIQMDGYNGTTLYVKELAISLIERGENVQIYSRLIGQIGIELREQGITIVNNLTDITFYPDVIHAHHNVTTLDVLSFFKNVPVLFWIHDRLSPFDHPPFHKNIVKYMAVDYNCKERYATDCGFSQSDSDVVYNWVNLKRFALKDTIQTKPKKALIFSNYANNRNFLVPIKKACAQCNLILDVIGQESGNQKRDPEKYLEDYDIIFAKAKAAMESIATGAGVIICDFRGLAGMVTTKNLKHYRKFNFGMKLMENPANEKNIINEIQKYNAKDIQMVSQMIRSQIDIHIIVDQLLVLYKDCVSGYQKGDRGKYNFKITNFLYIKMMRWYFIVINYLRNNLYFVFVLLRGFKRKMQE